MSSKIDKPAQKHGRVQEVDARLTLGAVRSGDTPYADLPDDTDILVLDPHGKVTAAQTVLVLEDDNTGKLAMLFSCLPTSTILDAMAAAAGVPGATTKH